MDEDELPPEDVERPSPDEVDEQFEMDIKGG